MASKNFNSLRQRTSKIYDKINRSTKREVYKIIAGSIGMQVENTGDIQSLVKTVKKQKTLLSTLQTRLDLLTKKNKRPKFTDLVDPFERFKGKGDKGGSGNKGLFGMIMAGLGLLLKPIKSSLKKLSRVVGKLAIKAVKGVAKAGVQAVASVGKKGLQAAITAGTKLKNVASAGGAGRVAVRQVAAFIGRGVVGAAAGAIGYPLLIASAAAAVGYGTYKLGRYLKLSEKLDEFIKKVSGGKYRDIADFILGVVDGSLGKELYGWVKKKIGELFGDAVTYLKTKTNDILGSLSPFANDPTTKPDDESEDDKGGQVGGEQSSPMEASSDSANDAFREKLSGGPAGIKTDMMAQISEFTGGGGGDSNISSNVESGKSAWRQLTGGKATEITSPFGPRKKPNGAASSNHKGIDIGADVGTNIYALEDGYFSYNGDASSKKGGGLQGFVKGTSGLTYGFAHLSQIKAKSGPVKKGDLVALSGNSGNSTGPHIHFTVKNSAGTVVNPANVGVPNPPLANKGGGTAKHGIGDDTGSEYSAKANPFSVKAAVSSTTFARTSSSPSRGNMGTSSSAPSSVSNMMKSSSMQPSSQSENMSASLGAPTAPTSTNKVKDPRGALSMDILNASTSPLFI